MATERGECEPCEPAGLTEQTRSVRAHFVAPPRSSSRYDRRRSVATRRSPDRCRRTRIRRRARRSTRACRRRSRRRACRVASAETTVDRRGALARLTSRVAASTRQSHVGFRAVRVRFVLQLSVVCGRCCYITVAVAAGIRASATRTVSRGIAAFKRFH